MLRWVHILCWVMAGACDWPQDNPLDPLRCEPPCPAGSTCYEGQCLGQDLGTGEKAIPCGPAICPNGCCLGEQCVAGTSDKSCGAGGRSCQNCTLKNASCHAGTCTPCEPSSCAGCCTSSQCLPGTISTSCGKQGVLCRDCTQTGGNCTSGTCSNPQSCGPGSCKGCCSNNECYLGNSLSACGANGTACAKCDKPYHTCLNGSCTVDPQSRWSIIAGNAVLSTAKVWDPKNPSVYKEPDPFLMLCWICNQTPTTGTYLSSYKGNTFNPVWNTELVSAYADQAFPNQAYRGPILKPFTLSIADSDYQYLLYEVIGKCTVQLTVNDLEQGYKTITLCPDPSDSQDYLISLKLELKHVP